MQPTAFLYKTSAKHFELYLGGYSTLEGIKLFSKDTPVKILDFGATGYKRFGWATEKEIPAFETISDLVSFFEEQPHLDLVIFKTEIGEEGTLSSHDDGECHITLHSKQQLFTIIKTVAPPLYQDKLLAALIENQDMYVTIDARGTIFKFHTFEQYLKSKT